MEGFWIALGPTLAVVAQGYMASRERRRIERRHDAKLAQTRESVEGKVETVRELVNGQHEALQALSTAQGATIAEQAATINRLDPDAGRQNG